MAFNTIRLKDLNGHVAEEAPAAGVITPGNFVAVGAAGTVDRAGLSYDGCVMVAVEDEYQGKGIDDAYAAADIVQIWIPRSGDQVYGIASAAIAAGANLSLAASGKVVTATDTTTPVIGEALEAAAADGDRICIRIK